MITDGHIQLFRVVDANGNPARVADDGTGVYRLAVDALISGSGGAADTRNADSAADFTALLIGVLTNTRLAAWDVVGGDWNRIPAIPDGSAGFAHMGVVQEFDTEYWAARLGRAFFATHQTPGTVVTGQTSFVDTTPTFLMRQAASSRRIVPRSIALTLAGTAPGGTVTIVVAIDTTDRLSAGGTAVTPQNANEDSATASVLTAFLTNPTATAAGAGTRYLIATAIAVTVPTLIQIDLKDGALVGITGSLLVYTFAATTGPSWYFTFKWSEVV